MSSTTSDGRPPLLEVEGLQVEFRIRGAWTPIITDVGLSVRAGETLGIVGESGSGKTLTSLAIAGLVPQGGRASGGRACLEGEDLLALRERDLERIRGRRVGMIFQDPRRSLNPAFTVGEQVAEVLRRHLGMARGAAWDRAVELLSEVSIPDAARRAHDYPHRFSGGMAQRVMLAMAIACGPSLLIADEPTTALDVTVQRQMLDLIAELKERMGLGVLFITHDLAVIAEVADRVAVMYAGEVVETGRVDEVLGAPRHPYTAGLLASAPGLQHRSTRLGSIAGTVPPPDQRADGCRFHPRCRHAVAACAASPPSLTRAGDRADRCIRSDELSLTGLESGPRADSGERPVVGTGREAATLTPVLEVRGLRKSFVLARNLLGRPSATLDAVRGVDLEVLPGETLALVGESGVGKSTVGRLALRLIEPDGGSVRLLGEDASALRRRALTDLRRRATMIFQNPYTSFDPKMLVGASVAEPMTVHGVGGSRRARADRAVELLQDVGLTDQHAERYPHELSGGELQRAAIARALSTDPGLIVCDEPVAALDMSIQSQVVNLLRDLQAARGIGYLFISHDLSLVRVIADRVAVMHEGRIVEAATADRLFADPQHSYTRALLAAIPRLEPRPARPEQPGATSGGTRS